MNKPIPKLKHLTYTNEYNYIHDNGTSYYAYELIKYYSTMELFEIKQRGLK